MEQEWFGAASHISKAKHRGHHGPRLEILVRILRRRWGWWSFQKTGKALVRQTNSSHSLLGRDLHRIQEFSHGSRSNCRYPQLISVSNWGFSSSPCNMLKGVKRLRIYLISSSPRTCLYFSPISFMQGEGEREGVRKRKQKKVLHGEFKWAEWHGSYVRSESLPRTARGFQHNICPAAALCQLW